MAAADKEGLSDDGHLELFTTWYLWQNIPNAPSLAELWQLWSIPGSAALIADLRTILRWLDEERTAEERHTKPKTGKRSKG